jgi:hypothetical protein|tara:strand:- start:1388 stop:1588 length:201 start_codon:yes stop_codon:yes gene_type:complete
VVKHPNRKSKKMSKEKKKKKLKTIECIGFYWEDDFDWEEHRKCLARIEHKTNEDFIKKMHKGFYDD